MDEDNVVILPWMREKEAGQFCEICRVRPYDVGVYNGDTDRDDLYCDDCYIAVFGKVGMPRSHLS